MKKLLITLLCSAVMCLSVQMAVSAKDASKPTAAPIVKLPIAQQANFWGDPKSKIYHIPSCKYVKKIKHGSAIDSPMTAKLAGYKPCKKCKPPKAK